MATYNTGNPLGSADPRDLYDNSGSLDKAVNDTEGGTWTDRNGVVRPTIQKALNDLAVSAGLGYEKLEELQQITPTEGLMAEVTNDGENTGRWRGDGTQWVKSDNPMEEKVVALENEMPNKVDKYDGNRPGVLVAITDSGGQATFLEANDTDGGPTDWSKKMIGESQGLRIASVPGYLLVVTDNAGNFTDLAIESASGRFAPFVIERLKNDIGYIPPPPKEILYPQNMGGSETIGAGDFYIRDEEVLPALTDMTKLAGWGSSSMDRSEAAYSGLAASLGMSWYNGGISGQATPQIAARAGSVPALCTFPGDIIPGDTTEILITTSNVPGHGSQTYFGTINGVAGRIRYSAGARFLRTTAGDPVPVEPNTPFIPDEGAAHRAALTLLWMGRNDLAGNPGNAEQCIKNTDATFDWLAPKITRRFVMGHFKGTLTPASPVWAQIDQVNNAHRRRYGHLFIDVNAYLIGSQVWTDMGITPTQADLDAQALGATPPSLLADTLHLTTAAYQAVATYCVRARMVALGWIQP